MIFEFIVEEEAIQIKDFLKKKEFPRNFRSRKNKEHLFFFCQQSGSCQLLSDEKGRQIGNSIKRKG